MSKQMKWGLATLLLLLGIAAVFLFIDKDTETEPEMTLGQPTKDLLKKGVKLPQQAETPVAVEELPPVVPPNEHPSGPHQHEDDTAHNHSPIVSQTSNGPLTFHAELLKTNPVKALRLQAEERGHVNAKWIPPFPPDDQEAQELAKAVYALIYNTNSDTPKLGIGGNSMLMMEEIYKKYSRTSARSCDLTKLTWVALSYQIDHYNSDGLALLPSDYFPEHISDLK